MLIVVSGGSGSGKSAYAEELAWHLNKERLFYIASMQSVDEESLARIRRHRAMRAGKGFETVECFMGLAGLQLPKNSTVLLEDLSNLTANEMFGENGAGEGTYEAVRDGILHLLRASSDLVVVTNELFSDGGCYGPETEHYLRTLGKLNVFAASAADVVVEVVYGIPVLMKGNMDGLE